MRTIVNVTTGAARIFRGRYVVFSDGGRVVRRHTNTKTETPFTYSFRVIFLIFYSLEKQESHRYVNCYKFPRSQKTQTTISDVFWMQ